MILMIPKGYETATSRTVPDAKAFVDVDETRLATVCHVNGLENP